MDEIDLGHFPALKLSRDHFAGSSSGFERETAGWRSIRGGGQTAGWSRLATTELPIYQSVSVVCLNVQFLLMTVNLSSHALLVDNSKPCWTTDQWPYCYNISRPSHPLSLSRCFNMTIDHFFDEDEDHSKTVRVWGYNLLFGSIFCYFIILSAPGASSGAKIEINKITRDGWVLEVLSVSGKISNNGDTTCYYSSANHYHHGQRWR